MSTRELTSAYKRLRTAHYPSIPSFVAVHVEPPEWMQLKQAIHSDLNQLCTEVAHIECLCQQRLKVLFDDTKEQQLAWNLERATLKVAALLKACYRRITTLDTMPPAPACSEDVTVRGNVMRHLAIQLSELEQRYRACHREFTSHREMRQPDTQATEEIVDDVITPQLQQQREDVLSGRRTQRIMQLAQQVQEVSDMFTRLHTLILVQGSALDRIDVNLEITYQKVEQGTAELEQADDYSRKSVCTKCTICLLVCIVVLIIVLALKLGMRGHVQ